MIKNNPTGVKIKRCMLVLGMHRSGTSALAGSYHALGYSAGKRMMPADPEQNAKGFFENHEFYLLNENILTDNQLTWDTDQKVDIYDLPPKKIEFYKQSIKRIIASEFDFEEENILIKDPRICLLLPLYIEALEELGMDVCATIIYRNPMQVHSSLQKRNEFSIDKSFRICTNYLLQAEFNSRRIDRLFISYATLLSNPESLITGIRQKLKLDIGDDLKAITQFLDVNLKHHKEEKIAQEGDYKMVSRIYSILRDQAGKPFNNLQILFNKLRLDFYNPAVLVAPVPVEVPMKVAEAAPNKMEGLSNLNAQLFINTGAGFTEENSFQKDTNIDTKSIRFELPEYKLIKEIRIDPINVICEIKIENIIFENDKGKFSVMDYTTNAKSEVANHHLIFDHNDPQIILSNIAFFPIHYVEIRYTIVSTGETSLAKLQANAISGVEKPILDNENFQNFASKILDKYLDKIEKLENTIELNNQAAKGLLIKATKYETLDQVREKEIKLLSEQLNAEHNKYQNQVLEYELRIKKIIEEYNFESTKNEGLFKAELEKSEANLHKQIAQLKDSYKAHVLELDKGREIELVEIEKRRNEKEAELTAIKVKFADQKLILDQELTAAITGNSVLRNEIAQVKSELKSIKVERDQMISNTNNLERSVLDTREEKEVLEAELVKLEVQQKENIALQATIKSRNAQIDSLEQKYKAEQSEKKSSRKDFKRLEKEKDSYLKKIESLHNDIIALRDEEPKKMAIITTYQAEVEKRGEAIDEIRASLSYKSGRFITYPARLIADLFKSPEYEDTYSTGKFLLIIKLFFIALMHPIATIKNLSGGKFRALRYASNNENTGQILNNYRNLLNNKESNFSNAQKDDIPSISRLEGNQEEFVEPRGASSAVQIKSSSPVMEATLMEVKEGNVAPSQSKPESKNAICKVHCDNLISTRFNFEMHGWAISPHGIESIEIFSDGKKLGEAIMGLPRPDVESHYPHISDAKNSGFKFISTKDTFRLNEIEIQVIDKIGSIVKVFQKDTYLDLDQQYEKFISSEIKSKKSIGKYQPKKFAINPNFGLILLFDDSPSIYIEKTLNSIRKQNYKRISLKIFSKPSNREFIDACKKKWPIIFKESKIIYLDYFTNLVFEINQQILSQANDWNFIVEVGDQLHSNMLLECVQQLNEATGTDLIYTDHDELSMYSQRIKPQFKPCLNHDLLTSKNYIGNSYVFSKRIFSKLDGFNSEYSNQFRYHFALTALAQAAKIEHISKVLYHERTYLKSNLNLDEEFEVLKNHVKSNPIKSIVEKGIAKGTYRIIREIKDKRKVSIVIPFKDDVDTLKTCLESIEKCTTYNNYELVLISNNSVEKETFDYLDSLKRDKKYKIFEYNVPFNYSRICNFGVSKAKGDLILLLNNDVEVITSSWLTAMVEHIQRPEVGAVGAKLLYHDNTVQHAGVILNLSGLAAHTHKYFPDTDDGYQQRANVIQNFSICTAACLLVEKSTFDKVAGLDEENLAVSFNDVDLCLKIRKENLLVVYTPYSKLYHYESKSRGDDDTPKKRKRVSKEIAFFRDKWKSELERGDPYYNKNLSLRRKDFSIKIDYNL